ncbi:MAG: hypothetical protein IPG02_09690 [Ignavibacteria bacterium]|jgi:hypothetical protein|nr:hypothetical protein [Ignavibacteria bacterium]MBK6875156.1 hypothetical protein [Ignavibacteria bacterium]MBK9228268.1 hypothetical protein [Ignavibacteria bacterium]
MIFLYHRAPINLRGNILYPLNELKDIYSDIYEHHLIKYVGREQLLKHQIPILGCLWNDVLHFSAVHPGEIKKSLIEAGDKKEFKLRYFQVDPKLLKSESTIVYLYAHADVRDKLNEVNFVSYAPDEAAKYSSMPQATKDYYKETIEKGGRPLLYHRIPHILYKGNLDITDLPVISI